MSDGENKDIIISWFEALNQADISLLDRLADECFAADFIEHDPRMIGLGCGPEVAKQFIHQLLEENTNVEVTLHDVFEYADKVASRFSVSMTNVASGQPVNLKLLAITRFADGQIAEEWQLSATDRW
jgi:ketosteroid isomerase-like protein